MGQVRRSDEEPHVREHHHQRTGRRRIPGQGRGRQPVGPQQGVRLLRRLHRIYRRQPVEHGKPVRERTRPTRADQIVGHVAESRRTDRLGRLGRRGSWQPRGRTEGLLGRRHPPDGLSTAARRISTSATPISRHRRDSSATSATEASTSPGRPPSRSTTALRPRTSVTSTTGTAGSTRRTNPRAPTTATRTTWTR